MKNNTLLLIAAAAGAFMVGRTVFAKPIPSDESDTVQDVLNNSIFGPTLAPYLINPEPEYQGRHGRNARNFQTGYTF